VLGALAHCAPQSCCAAVLALAISPGRQLFMLLALLWPATVPALPAWCHAFTPMSQRAAARLPPVARALPDRRLWTGRRCGDQCGHLFAGFWRLLQSGASYMPTFALPLHRPPSAADSAWPLAGSAGRLLGCCCMLHCQHPADLLQTSSEMWACSKTPRSRSVSPYCC
jgi:hypothetical protein